MRRDRVEAAFAAASERYAALGVDAAGALRRLGSIAISLQCWQGDDVTGLEGRGGGQGGGLAVAGARFGRARSAEELRRDAELALALIPGRHRFSLHAMYAETGAKRVERDELDPAHFRGWIEWARGRGLGLDFNHTYFAHPLAADGYTLAHRDERVRRFWIGHGVACRRIAGAMGEALGSPCVTNLWVPDGSRDTPVDRRGPRERLERSLDEVFAERFEPARLADSVEPKLFGIGSESYVAGSLEFYLGYAVRRNKLLCLDMGHFHPTETVSDKISSVLAWLEGIVLHASRGVRWDSDHVVTLSDELRAVAEEVVRGGYLERVRVGMDYFDAQINRVAAWVVGARCVLKAFLLALLEPSEALHRLEAEGDLTGRLALLEETRTLPSGAVWDYHCVAGGVPAGMEWLDEVRRYEREVLSKR